jgi:hypothetical protein
MAEVVVEHLPEAFHRLGCKLVHRPFDHAVNAPEVAPEVHRHLDVLTVIEAAHASRSCRRETVSKRV